MTQPLRHLKELPSQTAGPYVHIGCTPNWADIKGVYDRDLGSTLLTPDVKGERILIRGHVIDGSDAPLKDALIEIWQADAAGRYSSPADPRGGADPHFFGWARCPTNDADGEFCFETIKPGRAPHKDGRLMAPHITFWVVARGINVGLHTRMYFSDEAEANADDPVLARIEQKARVPTLIAERVINGHSQPVYHFSIRLQGENETVFFDI